MQNKIGKWNITSRLELLLAKIAGHDVDLNTMTPPVASNLTEELLLEIADKSGGGQLPVPTADDVGGVVTVNANIKIGKLIIPEQTVTIDEDNASVVQDVVPLDTHPEKGDCFYALINDAEFVAHADDLGRVSIFDDNDEFIAGFYDEEGVTYFVSNGNPGDKFTISLYTADYDYNYGVNKKNALDKIIYFEVTEPLSGSVTEDVSADTADGFVNPGDVYHTLKRGDRIEFCYMGRCYIGWDKHYVDADINKYLLSKYGKNSSNTYDVIGFSSDVSDTQYLRLVEDDKIHDILNGFSAIFAVVHLTNQYDDRYFFVCKISHTQSTLSTLAEEVE